MKFCEILPLRTVSGSDRIPRTPTTPARTTTYRLPNKLLENAPFEYNRSAQPDTFMDGRGRNLSFEFGPFHADMLTRRLSRDGKPLTLTAKAFDTLAVLLAHRGETVSKIDLMNAVWGETSVEENNLTQQISALRKVLGERARDHKFIVTVSGKGYCFVAPVKELSEAAAAEDRTVFAASASQGNRKQRLRLQLIGSDSLFGGGLAVTYVFVVCFAVVLFGGQNSQSRPQSVAVLTFRSLDAGDEPLGAGLRDTLRARLGSIEDITVRPTAPDVAEQNALEAGRRLHADVVLTGSIQHDEGRLRVAVEMVDIAGERVVWGGTFDETSSNIFELQDSIASEVVRVLRGSHSPAPRSEVRGPANQLEFNAAEFVRSSQPLHAAGTPTAIT